MFWRGLVVVLAGLAALGCLNSEADFQALLEENETLGAELAEAKKENEILTRALADIKQEQETLQLLLNAGQRSLAAGRAKLPPAALGSGEDQASAVAEGGQEEVFLEPAALESAAPEPAPESAAAPPASPPEPVAALEPAPEPDLAPPAAPAPARASGGRYYVTKPGDVLTSIARENQTTVAKLLELNPSLRNRRNYVIYNNERLRLP